MSGHDPLARVPGDLVPRLAGARLVALDVDGVLTDGRVVYLEGQEAQHFDVKDGQGLVWLARHGVEVVWITGRGCEATARRAAELGARLHSRVGPKHGVLTQVQSELDVPREATIAMGDDLADLAMARGAGAFVAPADAAADVRARADWVTTAPGGRGAVRELCEALLAARGAWQAIVDGAAG